MVYIGKMLLFRLLNSVFIFIYFEFSEMFRVKEESSSIFFLKDEFI